MEYPIYIEIPEGYWTYSCTIIEDVEDSSDENKDK